MRSRVLALCLAAFVVLGGGTSAFASANGVVISEFRFRGADGNDEFVELLNTSTAPVSIAGWRLQGCAAASGAPSARATVPAGVTLAPGQHYLFVNSAGTVAGDASYGTGISDDGGARITLADGTTVVDGVGSSSGAVDECREGAGLTIPTTNGDNSFERIGGSQDTDDNVADFVGPKAGNPQTFGAPPSPVSARIRDIQGLQHVSPLVDDLVKDVEGVVTARRTAGGRGFWMQDPAPDANNDTSEGIFVFTGATPTVAVGDLVKVAGRVSEFRPTNANNLTVTQIVSPTITPVSTGNSIPATVIGIGGRTPPTAIIDNDSSGSVETTPTTYDPAQDGIDFWESLEGMLLQVNNGAVVNETESFGEITVLPDDGSWATGTRTPRGGILPAPNYSDFNPERLAIDDEILRDLAPLPRPPSAMPIANVGDKVVGSIVGPLDYTFANYKIQALAPPVILSSGLTPETTTAPTHQEIAVATFNVENLDPGDGATIGRLAQQIVQNLLSPDLIAVQEVQDNTGATNDGTVDASQSWQLLIDSIVAAGGPAYQYRQIDPVNNADGGQPGGNIRVGFLFRTDRELVFIDRPGGNATTPVGVLSTSRDGARLTVSPGRIAPADPSFVDTRKSLVGEFKFRGRKLFVVANHFSSKGADEPLMGHNQPPDRLSEVARHGQAQVVNDFVDQIHAADPQALVIVLGDINDFEFSETVEILEGGGELYSAIKDLPAGERYSYVFEGNSQVLDQILLGRRLHELFEYSYDVVHVNSEFSDQASDHDPSVVRIRLVGRGTPRP